MIHDCAEDCEEKPREVFHLSPGVMIFEIDWDYFSPPGVEYGSKWWKHGYEEAAKDKAHLER